MRRLTGQVAFGCAMALHWLGTAAVTAAVLVSVGLGAAAWRLSQAPWELPWLTKRLENAINGNGGPTKLSIGSVALAWEGFRRGVERPLDLRVTNVVITGEGGSRLMSVPRAEVSVSLYELLLGRGVIVLDPNVGDCRPVIAQVRQRLVQHLSGLLM